MLHSSTSNKPSWEHVGNTLGGRVIASGLQRDELGLARLELEAEHGVAIERDS